METKLNEYLYKKAWDVIKSAKKILITSGAGMGVDSGMPDFRGPQGFWNIYKSFENKFTFQECANPSFLTLYPKYFWGFYGYRLNMYRRITPHYGFEILNQIIKESWIDDYFIVTSNVDGHFQKSGFLNEKIYEIHGSLNFMQCNKCNKIFDGKDVNVIVNEKTFEAEKPLPQCEKCMEIIRPNILMFGDYDFLSDRCERQEKNFEKFIYDIKKDDKFVIIEIGAGLDVSTIRRISENYFLKNMNSSLIRINLRDINTFSNNKKFEDNYIGLKTTGLEGLKKIYEQKQL